MTKARFMESVHFIAHHSAMFDHFEGRKPKPKAFYFAEAVLCEVRFRLAALRCKWRGHDYSDHESYASPEGASESFQCVRCGDVQRHVYF